MFNQRHNSYCSEQEATNRLKKQTSNEDKRLESKSRKNIFIFDDSRFWRTSIIFFGANQDYFIFSLILCDIYHIGAISKCCERSSKCLFQKRRYFYLHKPKICKKKIKIASSAQTNKKSKWFVKFKSSSTLAQVNSRT